LFSASIQPGFCDPLSTYGERDASCNHFIWQLHWVAQQLAVPVHMNTSLLDKQLK